MKLLLFEGVATTGKSTIEAEVLRLCETKNRPAILYHEDQTLIPLLGDKSVQASLELQNTVLGQIEQEKHDVVLVDRFLLSHLERTNGDLNDFAVVRDKLVDLEARIIFLQIDDQAFRPRLKDALARRAQKFSDHVMAKGGADVMLNKYVEQQQTMLKLLPTLGLSTCVFDTTNLNFIEIAEQITEKYLFNRREGPLSQEIALEMPTPKTL